MELRTYDVNRDAGPGYAPTGDDGAAASRRAQRSRFVTAGRAAVDRALSGDSSKTLEQLRQQGGQ